MISSFVLDLPVLGSILSLTGCSSPYSTPKKQYCVRRKMPVERRTERTDAFKAEAGNVKTLAMQALDADGRLLQVEPVIISRTQY